MTFARRILLCVTGLSPQVVTETLFSLTVMAEPPWLPTELHIVSTAEGIDRAALTLLGPEGAIGRLGREWDLPGLAALAGDARLHVVTDRLGRPLVDLLSPDDNGDAADCLADLVRRLTVDDTAMLHLSLAGGRKTMGFFAGYALSLFGRAQDELSHVLIPAELEQHPDFFFPPREPRVLFDRHNRPVRAEASAVRLAPIPFVRLRHGLPLALLEGRARYGEAVAHVAGSLGTPHLVVDLEGHRLIAAGTAILMPPVQLAFAAWLAQRRRDLPDGQAGLSWHDADPISFVDFYRRAGGTAVLHFRDGIGKEWFDERKARHNKLVSSALGWKAAPYRIEAVGKRPVTRFRLALPGAAIEIIG